MSNISYKDFVRGYYGAKPWGCREVEKALEQKKAKALADAREVERLTKANVSTDVLNRALEIAEKSREEFETFEKALFSGDVFANESIDEFKYVPSEESFSLGDINGRYLIGKERLRVPGALYNDTVCAEIVEEGGSATPLNLVDSLSVVNTEKADAITFEDVESVGANVYHDDKDNLSLAMGDVHKIHFINAENKKAFELMIGSKESVGVSANGILGVINANLCAKAKRKAVIVVNKSGFAKLDVEENGIPCVTKDSFGNFIYKQKYPIIEVADEILANGENGATPIIVGDLSIVNFYVIREDRLEEEFGGVYSVSSRNIRKEIITLSTISNEAFVVGYLE